MSNPRASVSFNEIGLHVTTYLRLTNGTGAIDYLPGPASPYPANRSSQQGNSVAVIASGTVYSGQSGDSLLGKLVSVEGDNLCTVQDRGYASFSYTPGSTAPVLGRGVVCDGAGGVAIAASGSEYKERGQVVELNTTAHTCTVFLR